MRSSAGPYAEHVAPVPFARWMTGTLQTEGILSGTQKFTAPTFAVLNVNLPSLSKSVSPSRHDDSPLSDGGGFVPPSPDAIMPPVPVIMPPAPAPPTIGLTVPMPP